MSLQPYFDTLLLKLNGVILLENVVQMEYDLSLCLVLSQMNPAILIPYIFKIHFNYLFPPMSTYPQPVDSFQDFPYEVCTDLLPSLCVLYMLPILIYHWEFSVSVYEVSNSLAGQNGQLILLMSGKNAACLREISVHEVH